MEYYLAVKEWTDTHSSIDGSWMHYANERQLWDSKKLYTMWFYLYEFLGKKQQHYKDRKQSNGCEGVAGVLAKGHEKTLHIIPWLGVVLHLKGWILLKVNYTSISLIFKWLKNSCLGFVLRFTINWLVLGSKLCFKRI